MSDEVWMPTEVDGEWKWTILHREAADNVKYTTIPKYVSNNPWFTVKKYNEGRGWDNSNDSKFCDDVLERVNYNEKIPTPPSIDDPLPWMINIQLTHDEYTGDILLCQGIIDTFLSKHACEKVREYNRLIDKGQRPSLSDIPLCDCITLKHGTRLPDPPSFEVWRVSHTEPEGQECCPYPILGRWMSYGPRDPIGRILRWKLGTVETHDVTRCYTSRKYGFVGPQRQPIYKVRHYNDDVWNWYEVTIPMYKVWEALRDYNLHRDKERLREMMEPVLLSYELERVVDREGKISGIECMSKSREVRDVDPSPSYEILPLSTPSELLV